MEGPQKKAPAKPKKVYHNNNFKQKNGPAKQPNSLSSNFQNMNLIQGPPPPYEFSQQQHQSQHGTRNTFQTSSTNFNLNPLVPPQQPLTVVSPSPVPIADQSSMENLLKCTICSTIRKPPIFCCSGGHNICSLCRATKIQCTVCNQGLTDVRNMCAEALAMNYRFGCSFQGCIELLNFSTADEHRAECDFRPVGCEVYPCEGKRIEREDYIEHQRKVHHAQNAEIVPNKSTGRMTWRKDIGIRNVENLLRQGMRPPTIMEFAGYTFFLRTQAVGHKIWFWVALFGSPTDAKRFKTTITIKKGEGHNKIAASWTGPVHSVRHTGDDVYLHGLCMVSTEECLKAFLFKKNAKSFYTVQIEIDCIA